MNLEDYFNDLAVLNGKPAVILYDRGVMDPKAYMGKKTTPYINNNYNYNYNSNNNDVIFILLYI